MSKASLESRIDPMKFTGWLLSEEMHVCIYRRCLQYEITEHRLPLIFAILFLDAASSLSKFIHVVHLCQSLDSPALSNKRIMNPTFLLFYEQTSELLCFPRFHCILRTLHRAWVVLAFTYDKADRSRVNKRMRHILHRPQRVPDSINGIPNKVSLVNSK